MLVSDLGNLRNKILRILSDKVTGKVYDLLEDDGADKSEEL